VVPSGVVAARTASVGPNGSSTRQADVPADNWVCVADGGMVRSRGTAGGVGAPRLGAAYAARGKDTEDRDRRGSKSLMVHGRPTSKS
jgi:hypothetical protein